MPTCRSFVDPPFVQRIAAGQDLRAMLLSGEIDAGVALRGAGSGAVAHGDPRCGRGGGRVVRRTGVYPMNHVVVGEGANCWPRIRGWPAS